MEQTNTHNSLVSTVIFLLILTRNTNTNVFISKGDKKTRLDS